MSIRDLPKAIGELVELALWSPISGGTTISMLKLDHPVPKVITFDCYGTLVQWHLAVRKRRPCDPFWTRPK